MSGQGTGREKGCLGALQLAYSRASPARSLRSHQFVNKPARNALFLFGGEGASRLLGFLTAAVLARRVGVDGFGQIGFATAILAYGMVITDFGLVSLGTREMARDKSRAQQLAGSVLSFGSPWQ